MGSLSDTALKYAKDMDKIDILYIPETLYIQETCEDEFKNKETRLIRTVIIWYMGGWLAVIVLYDIIAVILVIWKAYNHYNKKN